jgi:hypothetical protein
MAAEPARPLDDDELDGELSADELAEQEAQERRARFKAVTGEGQDNGEPTNRNLSLAPEPQKTQPQPEEGAPESSPQGRPNLRLIQGGKDQDKAKTAGGAGPKLNNPLSKAAFQRVGGFARKNRKKLILGSGLLSVFMAIIMGFFALLPLKLEAFTKNFYNSQAQRMESYVEKRVLLYVVTFMYKEALNTLADDGIYTGSSIMRTAWGNMRTQQFTKKLYEEKGIRMVRAGVATVRFEYPGGQYTGNSTEAIMEHVNKDLSGRQARAAIKVFVRDQTQWHQFLKRRHMRKYLINAYNIRRFSIPKREDKTKDDGKTVSPTETDIRANEMDPSLDMSIAAVGCVTGEACDETDDRSTNPDGEPGIKAPIPDGGRQERDQATETTQAGLRQTLQDARKVHGKLVQDFMQKALEKAVVRVLLDSLPVVGWLVLAADVDDFIWNGKWIPIGIAIRSSQYAGVAATWVSLGDQLKAGELTAGQFNIIMMMLADAEKSNAFQRVFLNSADAGVKIEESKKVGSDGGIVEDASVNCAAGYALDLSKLGNPPEGYNKFIWHYRALMGSGIHPTHQILCPLRGIANVVADILGAVTGPVNDFLIGAIDFLLPGEPMAQLMNKATEVLGWLVNKIWAPVYNGEWGAPLANAMLAGWEVISNQFCRDSLGCANMTWAQAHAQNTNTTYENAAIVAASGPFARVLDTSYPSSIGSQFLATMPATPGQAVNQFGNLATTMLSNPGAILLNLGDRFWPRANAAPPTSSFAGVQATGYTDAQNDDPKIYVPVVDVAGRPDANGQPSGPDGEINQYDCVRAGPNGEAVMLDGVTRASDPTKINPCLRDLRAGTALCAGTGDDDDGGLGGNGEPGPCSDPPDETIPVNTGNPSTGTLPTGDVRTLAQQVLDNSNILKTGRLVRQDLEDAVAGRPSSAGEPLSAKMLAVLLELAKTTTFSLTALESGGTGHSSTSHHYRGTAADIVPEGGYSATFRRLHDNRVAYGIDQLIYSNPPLGTNNLFRGQSHSYDADTLSEHRDHIHFSTSN